VNTGLNQTTQNDSLALPGGTMSDESLRVPGTLASSENQLSEPGIVTFGNNGRRRKTSMDRNRTCCRQ